MKSFSLIVACALSALAGHLVHGPSASAAGVQDRTADRAAIEKLRQQDISATVARDAVALTDFWTEDAIRLGIGAPAEIGKAAIRASNDRQTADKNVRVLSYVPEVRDLVFLDGGWAVQ